MVSSASLVTRTMTPSVGSYLLPTEHSPWKQTFQVCFGNTKVGIPGAWLEALETYMTRV